MLPGILTQLGPEGLNQLKRLASNVVVGNKLLSSVNEEDDVPDLVENFEEASKNEVIPEATKVEEKITEVPAAAVTEEVKKVEPTPPTEATKVPVAAAAAAAPAVASPVKSGSSEAAPAADKKSENTPKKNENKGKTDNAKKDDKKKKNDNQKKGKSDDKEKSA